MSVYQNHDRPMLELREIGGGDTAVFFDKNWNDTDPTFRHRLFAATVEYLEKKKMTDYSKLSDAEIAERVCRKLGAPVGEDYYANLLWATQQIPVHEDSFDFYRDYEDIEGTRKRLFAFLCFDWTAPIMMQKVKEWLIKEEVHFEYWVDWQLCNQMKPYICHSFHARGEPIVRAKSETRALYEAFLQVEE